ncbi:MAG: hypothetical protein Q7Q71_07895 [Verrucomicrobiota bacterium JB023]|nr:hypothetical protein [Verrucomicrobiota bacterium JB023]
MATHLSIWKKSFTLLASLAFLSGGLAAQQVKVDVDDPVFEDLDSPEFNGAGSIGKKKWDPKQWLEAEVKIRIQARPEPKDGYLDELRVKWYVAVENPAGKGYFLLEKEITYVNIPVDEDVFSSVYLSPSSIQRLTGNERASKNDVWGVAGEVMFNGESVATFNSQSRDKWWESPQLSRTNKFPLLSKKETPFASLWYDRYLQEQEDNR